MDRDSRASGYRDRDRDPNQDRGRNQGRNQGRGQYRGQYRGQNRGQNRGQYHGRGRSPRDRRSLSPHRQPFHRPGRDEQVNRIQRRIQNEAFEALTIEQLPRAQDVQEPSPGAYVFPCIAEDAINLEYPRAKDKPDLLERINPRVQQSQHWYSPTSKEGKFRVKGTLSDQALEYLTNTIKYLAKKEGAVSFNMEIQLLTPDQATDHHHRTVEAYERVRALGNQHPSQAAARSASVRPGSSTTRTGSQGQPARRPEPEQATEPLLRTDNGPMQPQLICGNCKNPGHTLADCVIPNQKNGYVRGCPICNNNNHLIDDCKELPADEILRRRQALDYLYTKRLNKPMILTEKYPWPFLVVAVIEEELEKAAQEGNKLTQEEIMEREKLVPPNHMYPWSTDFAKEIMDMPSTELNNIHGVHPCNFDHQAHSFRDLPIDSLCHGSFGSLVEVLMAYGEKRLNIPVPLSQKKVKKHSDRPKHMEATIKRELYNYGLLPAIVQTKEGPKFTGIKIEPEARDLEEATALQQETDKYQLVLKKAREATKNDTPEHRKPAERFPRPRVDAISGKDIVVFEIPDEEDEHMEGTTPLALPVSRGTYIGPARHVDKVKYELKDPEGEWYAWWAVWNYIHLDSKDFAALPRSAPDEPDKMKVQALNTIDSVLRKWKQGQLAAPQPYVDKQKDGHPEPLQDEDEDMGMSQHADSALAPGDSDLHATPSGAHVDGTLASLLNRHIGAATNAAASTQDGDGLPHIEELSVTRGPVDEDINMEDSSEVEIDLNAPSSQQGVAAHPSDEIGYSDEETVYPKNGEPKDGDGMVHSPREDE